LKPGVEIKVSPLWKVAEMKNPIVPLLWNAENPQLMLSNTIATSGCFESKIDLDGCGGSVVVHASWSSASSSRAVKIPRVDVRAGKENILTNNEVVECFYEVLRNSP
jgi:hypothetical protein